MVSEEQRAEAANVRLDEKMKLKMNKEQEQIEVSCRPSDGIKQCNYWTERVLQIYSLGSALHSYTNLEGHDC